MKRVIPFLIWRKVNENWGNNMNRISHGRKSHCKTYISVWRNKQSERASLSQSQPGIRVGKLTISVRSFDTEKL